MMESPCVRSNIMSRGKEVAMTKPKNMTSEQEAIWKESERLQSERARI